MASTNNLKKTQEFFNQWQDYHRLVEELDTYKATAEILRGEIRGTVLDVGNGGVFNYDVQQAEKIVLVDIAEELVAKHDWPPNVTFKWGDATHLPVESDSFDTVLLQLILHQIGRAHV